MITHIRDLILDSPGIENVDAETLVSHLSVSAEDVSIVFEMLGQLGQFYSSKSTEPDSSMIVSIGLQGDYAYDDYLSYKGVDGLLERFLHVAWIRRRTKCFVAAYFVSFIF